MVEMDINYEQSCFKIEEYGIYYLTDEYMQMYYPKDFPNEHDGIKRPFMLLKEEPNGICWMAPLSTKLDKYQAYLEKYKNSVAFITTPNGRTSAVVISNVVPVQPKHIRDPYVVQNIPYVLRKNSIKMEINKKLNSYLFVMSQDYVSHSREIKDLYFELNHNQLYQSQIIRPSLEQQITKYEITREVMKVTKQYDLRDSTVVSNMSNKYHKVIKHEDR